MRHLSRTQRVSVAWLHEQYERESFTFTYVRPCDMVADMFTKSIPNPEGWCIARRKINVFSGLDELGEVASAVVDTVCVTYECFQSFACAAVPESVVEVTPRSPGAAAEVTPRSFGA